MHRLLVFAFVFYLSVLPAKAAPEAQIDCAHCGRWELTNSEPPGAAGESISILADLVSLPTCGMFRFEVLQQAINVDVSGSRTYQSILALSPLNTAPLCETTSHGAFRLEIVSSVGFRKDAGRGHFTLFKPGETAAKLIARGWNTEREDPCDSGSADGSIDCMEISNAALYRNLAQLTYASYQQIPIKGRKRVVAQFNPARFTAEVLRFCVEREANSGGFNWPYAWALSCKADRLRAKLAEFYALSECSKSNHAHCSFPNEQFDRSSSKAR